MTNEQKYMKAAVGLGLQSQMEKTEAREALDFLLLSRQVPPIEMELELTARHFGWSVLNRYFPLKEAMWKVETAKTKKFLIERDLVGAFAELPMKSLDKFRLQIHLNNLAKEKS